MCDCVHVVPAHGAFSIRWLTNIPKYKGLLSEGDGGGGAHCFFIQEPLSFLSPPSLSMEVIKK